MPNDIRYPKTGRRGNEMWAIVALISVIDPNPEIPMAGEVREEVRFEKLGDWIVQGSDRKRFGWSWKPGKINLADESFVVVVPSNFANDYAHGLLVYISPTDRGWMLSRHLHREQLIELLHAEKLIYISANRSGNNRQPLERLQLALTAAANATSSYRIDRNRIVVAGFSGGGRMATIAGRYAPKLFGGVVAIGGCNFHRMVQAPDGKYYRPDMKLAPGIEQEIRKNVAFAFVSGPGDANYQSTLDISKAYRTAGFQVHVVDVPGLGHEIPAAEHLKQAIAFAAGSDVRNAKFGGDLTPSFDRHSIVSSNVAAKLTTRDRLSLDN